MATHQFFEKFEPEGEPTSRGCANEVRKYSGKRRISFTTH
jgi:hypothetical protein